MWKWKMQWQLSFLIKRGGSKGNYRKQKVKDREIQSEENWPL